MAAMKKKKKNVMWLVYFFLVIILGLFMLIEKQRWITVLFGMVAFLCLWFYKLEDENGKKTN